MKTHRHLAKIVLVAYLVFCPPGLVSASRALVCVPREDIWSITWSPDGTILASGTRSSDGKRGRLRLWSAKSGHLLRVLNLASGMRSVAWSPDGTTLAGGTSDGHIRLWDSRSGHLLRILNTDSDISSLAWSPDSKTLVSANCFHNATLWNARSGQELRSLTGNASICALAWSPDGKTLAGGGSGLDRKDRIVTLWNTESGERLRTFIGHSGDFSHEHWQMAFSPDGKILASGADATVDLWNMANGQLLRTLDAGPYVAWGPDSKALATSTRGSGEVQLWNLESGRLLRTLSAYSDLTTVAWSPDGKTVVGGGDENLFLWNVESGHLRQCLPPYADLRLLHIFVKCGEQNAKPIPY